MKIQPYIYKYDENVDLTKIYFGTLCIFYLIIFFSFTFGTLSFEYPNSISFGSLVWFIILCALSIVDKKKYFTFLVFVLLAFPAPINDFSPSVLLTTIHDNKQVLFPIITHIDLYLILGICLNIGKSNNNRFSIPVIRLKLPLKLFFILYLIVFFVNILKGSTIDDFNLLVAHTFHLRYFLLLIFLLQMIDIKKYANEITKGVILSVVFLLLESMLNSKINDIDRLSSGSLSLNTFANIMAAIFLYMFVLLKKKQVNYFWGICTLLISFIIMIGSKTRGAFISLILGFILLTIGRRITLKALGNVFKVFLCISFLLFIYYQASIRNVFPDRYSYQKIFNKINIDFSENSVQEIFKFEQSWETSSLITRLKLYDTSLNMIKSHPITGIGAGRWNKEKNNYSTLKDIPHILLDSHNDYLALLSQYGIPLGLLMSYLVFFYPRILFLKFKEKVPLKLGLLSLIGLVMGICALSNSGFFKYQISAVLFLSLAIQNKLYYDYD